MTLQKGARQAVNSAALCALVIPIPQLALAADTTINTAQTTTQGPTTVELDGDDTLTIGPTGSVTVTGLGAYGIQADGGSNTITNSGSISADGEGGVGISFTGKLNAITNSGSISTAGDDINISIFGAGISGLGTFNTITNSGSITTAEFSAGIQADGDSNTITNSGSIITAGDGGLGIEAIGSKTMITNIGSISTAGAGAIGINTQIGSNTITNSGSITTVGNDAYGIQADGDSNTITNSGSISTTGFKGLSTQGDSNTITNSGSIISAELLGGQGIFSGGNSNTITNSGLINTVGTNAYSPVNLEVLATRSRDYYGIYAQGDSNTITNSGSITTGITRGYGIQAVGASNAIINSGSITTAGQFSDGIFTTGNSNTITNSGSIRATGERSWAISLNRSGNTFNTINDLFIGGRMAMGTDGVVNFTTGANHSKLYTFEATNSVLAAINSAGPVPLFINAATLQTATYDPTIFASSSDALADMTSTISSLTPGRFNGSDKDHPLWLRGFGMAASYDGSDATLERSYRYSGVAIGYDLKRSKDLSLGVLGGYGQSSQRANSVWTQSFNNTSNDGFLGLYGQKRWKKVAFDFALYGGIQSFQLQRYVNDNLANLGSSSVGNSSANASYQGLWLAPEAGITYNAGEVNGWSILPTARLRYAQQWMGGYTESGGGEANATVNGRSVAIGQMFVGIGTRKTIKTPIGKGTKMVLDGQVGYLYRGVVGDDSVNVTMIGQSLSLPTESTSRNAVAISAGVTLDLSRAVALKIRGDLAAGSGLQYGTGGWVGLNVKF